MLTDEFGYVLNGKATYRDIAEKLKNKIPVIICWTDELGWCQNILFSFGAYQQLEPIKNILTGYHPAEFISNLLFVSVDSGFWGFAVNNEITTDNYIGEKLKLDDRTITNERLANLINGVKLTLYDMLKNPQEFDFSKMEKYNG